MIRTIFFIKKTNKTKQNQAAATALKRCDKLSSPAVQAQYVQRLFSVLIQNVCQHYLQPTIDLVRTGSPPPPPPSEHRRAHLLNTFGAAF